MTTSELEKALQGDTDWRSFCDQYQKEKERLFLRKDGAATSGDLGLSFDSGKVVVTARQVLIICETALEKLIRPSDVQFLATLIALSGFDFDNDNTESAVHLLSTPGSVDLEQIHDAVELLNAR